MRLKATIAFIFLSLHLISACTALKSPSRPVYIGEDIVSLAMSSQLLGVWTVSELNPVPGSKNESSSVEYRENGTVTSLVELDASDAGALENLQFELNGNWTLNADIVTHINVKMSSTIDSEIGNIISDVINNRPATSVAANIYELTENRMVMVGADGVAKQYIRQ